MFRGWSLFYLGLCQLQVFNPLEKREQEKDYWKESYLVATCTRVSQSLLAVAGVVV